MKISLIARGRRGVGDAPPCRDELVLCMHECHWATSSLSIGEILQKRALLANEDQIFSSSQSTPNLLCDDNLAAAGATTLSRVEPHVTVLGALILAVEQWTHDNLGHLRLSERSSPFWVLDAMQDLPLDTADGNISSRIRVVSTF